jgi:hypothetical protein
VKSHYEVISIIYIHKEGVYGSCDKLGAFASTVKYTKDDIEYEVTLENDEFSVMDEIVFEHVEEEN